MVDFNQILQKAKDFASKNPDKVRQGIDKAEAVVSSKTGGKYDSQIHSAGDQVEKQLGVPTEDAAEPSQPPTGQNPADEGNTGGNQ